MSSGLNLLSRQSTEPLLLYSKNSQRDNTLSSNQHTSRRKSMFRDNYKRQFLWKDTAVCTLLNGTPSDGQLNHQPHTVPSSSLRFWCISTAIDLIRPLHRLHLHPRYCTQLPWPSTTLRFDILRLTWLVLVQRARALNFHAHSSVSLSFSTSGFIYELYC